MHPLLRAAAERQFGVFTATDARRAGYDRDEVRGLLSTGAWVRLRRGVYTTRERADDAARRHLLDCVAVLLDLGRPQAALSHATAARLHGFLVSTTIDRTTRVTDPARWREGKGFRMTRAPLDARSVVVRGPLRVTRAARTLVDCAREWDLESSVIAMDRALLMQRTTPAQLRAALVEQHQWRGTPMAQRAMALADGRAESPLETKGRLRLIGAGLAPTELQVEISVGGRLVAVADAWYEDAAVVVEFDGRVKYTDPWRGKTPQQVLWDEKRREDELRALDIRVVRVVDADVRAGWPRVEQRVRQLLAVPGPARRAFTATPRELGVRRSA